MTATMPENAGIDGDQPATSRQLTDIVLGRNRNTSPATPTSELAGIA